MPLSQIVTEVLIAVRAAAAALFVLAASASAQEGSVVSIPITEDCEECLSSDEPAAFSIALTQEEIDWLYTVEEDEELEIESCSEELEPDAADWEEPPETTHLSTAATPQARLIPTPCATKKPQVKKTPKPRPTRAPTPAPLQKEVIKVKIKRQCETCDKEGNRCTPGTLTIGDQTFCTLELPWRDNEKNVSCVPKGTYTCKRRNSPTFGWTYEIMNVGNGRGDVLFHRGNFARNTHGCILIGVAFVNGMLSGSRVSVEKFLELLGNAETFELIIE